MINSVSLTGRLTQEPQLKKTQSNKSVVQFSLAVQRDKDNADFINCVAWEKTAETICTYMHKGTLMGIEGRIQTRNYDDPAVPNRKIYVTEVWVRNISFLESNKREETPIPEEPKQKSTATVTIRDEDLPF